MMKRAAVILERLSGGKVTFDLGLKGGISTVSKAQNEEEEDLLDYKKNVSYA
jgi:hypothetical protein